MSYNTALQNFSESLQIMRMCPSTRFEVAQTNANEALATWNDSQRAFLKTLLSKYGGEIAMDVIKLLDAEIKGDIK